MEFNETQIAGLVLGYLKEKSYMSAYKCLLATSEYFKSHKNNYLVTRVGGLCLTDFLTEYAKVYTIVNALLENSNYYNDKANNTSEYNSNLSSQLLYLLNNYKPPFQEQSEVETSNEHLLPGNIEDTDCLNRKSVSPIKFDSDNHRTFCFEEILPDVSEILTQTFLENQALQEKLADTINIVRNSADISKENASNDKITNCDISKELDSIINAVVEKTEEDPIYKKLIDEVIDITVSQESSPLKKAVSGGLSEIPEDRISKNSPKKVDQRFNYKDTPRNEELKAIDANVKTVQNGESDIYVFNGTLDSYLKSSKVSTCTDLNIKNPADDNITTSSQNKERSKIGNNKVDQPKQIYFLNTSSVFATKPASVPCSSNFTESEIMTMPTVIVNETANTTLNKGVAKNIKYYQIVPNTVQNTCTNQCIIITTNSGTEIKKDNETVHNFKKIGDKSKDASTLQSASTSSQVKNTHIVASTPKGSITNISTKSTEINYTLRSKHHVRNLDFSKPLQIDVKSGKETVPTKLPAVKNKKKVTPSETLLKSFGAWDADLRTLTKVTEDSELPSSYASNTNKKISSKLSELPSKEKLNNKPTTIVNENKNSLKMSGHTKDKDLKLDDKDEVVTKSVDKVELKGTSYKKKSPMNDAPNCSNNNNSNSNNPNTESNKMSLEAFPSTISLHEKSKNIMEWVHDSLNESTPFKNDLPKTPFIPNNFCGTGFTPFTEVLEDQLKGVDIASISTPHLPITPGLHQTLTRRYSNRTTDYSTGSSYYVPSDNEQNKSIDQLIEECQRLEGSTPGTAVNIISNILVDNQLTSTRNSSPDTKNSNKRLDKFHQMIVGKKNLDLINHAILPSLSSSDSSTDDLNDDSENNDSTYLDKEACDTVIYNDSSTFKKINTSQNTSNKDLDKYNKKQIADKLKVDNSTSKIGRKSNCSTLKHSSEKAKKKQPVDHINKVDLRKSPKKTNFPDYLVCNDKLPVASKRSSTKNNSHCTITKKRTIKEPKTKYINAPVKNVEHMNLDKDNALDKSDEYKKPDNILDGMKQMGFHLLPSKTQRIDKTASSITKLASQNSNSTNMQTGSSQNVKNTKHVVLFDRQHFDNEICVSHKYNVKTARSNSYEPVPKLTKKTLNVHVFVEEINSEVTIGLNITEFDLLMDLNPGINLLIPRKSRQSIGAHKKVTSQNVEENSVKYQPSEGNRHTSISSSKKNKPNNVNLSQVEQNNQTDTTASSHVNKKENLTTKDVHRSYTKGGKRKKSMSDDENQCRKQKKCPSHVDLLKTVDVDMFLNQIHGE